MKKKDFPLFLSLSLIHKHAPHTHMHMNSYVHTQGCPCLLRLLVSGSASAEITYTCLLSYFFLLPLDAVASSCGGNHRGHDKTSYNIFSIFKFWGGPAIVFSKRLNRKIHTWLLFINRQPIEMCVGGLVRWLSG